MEQDVLNNNKVFLQGEVYSEPQFNHTVYDENFYSFIVSVPRLSGKTDLLPVMVSDKLLAVHPLEIGQRVAVNGQYRSHNLWMDGKSRLILSVFCREFAEYDEEANPNIIELDGYICKPPIYRTTPFSREICDITVAVNRNYDKSDYIPCIAWGRNAGFVANMPIGSQLKISGRIQSRNYEKKLESGEGYITKTAYEVSISNLSLINNVTIRGA